MKYIKLKYHGFVLFENTQTHMEMALSILGSHTRLNEVESAGSVKAVDWYDNGQVVCSGESIGLGLRAAEGDTDMLRTRLAH